MKKSASVISLILLLIILCSSCGEPGTQNDLTLTALISDGERETVLVKGTVTPTTVPFSTSTPIREMYQVDYLVKPPSLFNEAITKASLESFSPLTIDFCDNGTDELWQGEYIFAVAVQFPEIKDEISINEIKKVWGGAIDDVGFAQLVISEEFKDLFTGVWGSPDHDAVQFLEAEEIVNALWENPSRLALMPFDQLEPRVKVLTVDEQNPMRESFNSEIYPLAFNYCLYGENDAIESRLGNIPVTNRDENKITTLLMTGVTALTRETAYKMEQNGVAYPAEKIKMWFDEAEIVHISNEVSFTEECPEFTGSLSPSRFCSRPIFLDLLKDINVGVIELTGNHLLDYGENAFQESLILFREADIPYFGGGTDLKDAQSPLFFEESDNQLAFLGCNVPGPDTVFATMEFGGANPCNLDELVHQVRELSSKGYQVIVGIQYYEACQVEPMSGQRDDFQRLAEAGAVIVSGSQAHCPQGITFLEDSFIHYGLGNLFFDQMWDVYRNAFLDYHVFYDGRYLGAQLFTTRLEDASQPRPMTEEERSQFLIEIFSQCDWGGR